VLIPVGEIVLEPVLDIALSPISIADNRLYMRIYLVILSVVRRSRQIVMSEISFLEGRV
jgi:hypothetical protein